MLRSVGLGYILTPVTCFKTVFFCAHYLQENKTLQSLNLSNNNIGDDGAAAISEALTVRPTCEQRVCSLFEFWVGSNRCLWAERLAGVLIDPGNLTQNTPVRLSFRAIRPSRPSTSATTTSGPTVQQRSPRPLRYNCSASVVCGLCFNLGLCAAFCCYAALGLDEY